MARGESSATFGIDRFFRIVDNVVTMDGTSYSTYEMRVRAVEAVRAGMPMVSVAEAYRTDRTTIHRWLVRYHEEGDQGLQRRPVDGRPRKLPDLDERCLCGIVLKPASTYGYETDLWSVRRLHQVIRKHYDASVSKHTVWRRLREAGLTYQKPERQYFQMDPKERREWLEVTLPTIRETVREYRAILYCEDEANVSLTAFLGKTWAPRGETPRVKVTGKRGGLAAMSAISPRGHLFFMLYEKRITSVEVISFLNQLIDQHKRRHVVVIMDQAPPHTSKMTQGYIASQKRLHVFHLPKYSPDWNPDEKVWNHLKHEELKAHQATTKDELKKLTRRKLRSMSKNPDLIHGLYFRCCVAELLQ